MTSRVTCRVLAMDLRGHGSAMDVLHSMQNFLRGRPKSFKSIDHAIEWSVKSGQIRNLESAKVSMVGQVRRSESVDAVPSEQPNPVNDVVAEGHEEFYDLNYVTSKGDNTRTEPKRLSVYSWRIDLSKAEKYWDGWFRGISNLFLSCNVPKLLLLAGIDRLDRDLTIGQMQGKFMMQVLPPCGHAVHEDTPDKKSTIDRILVLRIVMECKREYRQSFLAAFVDFRKGLGSVDRAALLDVLRLCGIPHAPSLRLLDILSTGTGSAVQSGGGRPSVFFFPVDPVVRHRCVQTGRWAGSWGPASVGHLLVKRDSLMML
ncbi:PPME1 methylesterase, partial [Polypterus senegalus]